MIIARTSNIIAPKQDYCFWTYYYCADIDCCFAILRHCATLLPLRNIRAQSSNIIAFTGSKNDPSPVYGAKICTPSSVYGAKITAQFSLRPAPSRIPSTNRPNHKLAPHHHTDPNLLWLRCPSTP